MQRKDAGDSGERRWETKERRTGRKAPLRGEGRSPLKTAYDLKYFLWGCPLKRRAFKGGHVILSYVLP